MRRRRFIPSVTGRLEDRVVPSHVGAAAVVARANSLVDFGGPITVVSTHGVDTLAQQAALYGVGSIAGVGRVGLFGQLNTNFVNVRGFPVGGAIALVAPGGSGVLVLSVSGAHADLAPTGLGTVSLSFNAVAATGRFARDARAHGTAALTVAITGFTVGNYGQPTINRGGFFLVLNPAGRAL